MREPVNAGTLVSRVFFCNVTWSRLRNGVDFATLMFGPD